MKIGFRIILTVVMLLNAMSAYAYNMRQTLNRDGLSNSAILSMAQDDDGYLWIGTCDGVNIADGRSVNSFSQIFPGQALSGNIIEDLYNGGNGRMWVLTDKGIRVANLPQSVGEERVIRVDVVDRRPILFAKSLGNEIYLIDDEGWICRVRRNGSREGVPRRMIKTVAE